MNIHCGHCKSTHSSVVEVKACAGIATTPATVSEAWHGKCASTHEERKAEQARREQPLGMVNRFPAVGTPATEKQMNFLCTLLAECANLSDPDNAHTAEAFASSFAANPITKAAASKAITAAKEAKEELERNRQQAQRSTGTFPTLEDGMYRKADGTIVKVYHTVHGANQQAAKVLVVTGVEPGKYEGEFVYQGKRGLKGLDASMLLSQEEAAKLGQVYGFCVRCARTLTLEESQHVGYGKTCAGHMGWWYPTRAELKALTAQSA
jgi:hypothetical protein